MVGIRNDERVKLDFDTLPTVEDLAPIELDRRPVRPGRTAMTWNHFHPKIQSYVDTALSLNDQWLPIPTPSVEHAIELGRQVRAAGRVHDPKLTVKSELHEKDDKILIIRASVTKAKLPTAVEGAVNTADQDSSLGTIAQR